MKFLCKTKDILQTINVVSRAISGQQALPILNNILFQVEGKCCTLSATNLEFSIISHFEAEVENEGTITVPAKAIQNFAQYTTDKDVLFESNEDSQLRCQSKKTKTFIAGESAGEYPTIAPIQKETQIVLLDEELLNAIHHVSFASAKTTTRPVLSGVYFRAQKKELILVATDSYRLSEYKTPVIESQGEVECIAPSKVLIEIMSILGGAKRDRDGDPTKQKDEKKGKKKEAGNPITVTLNSQQIEFVIGRTTILSRLIDGSFPDYQQILPTNHITKATLPLPELLTDIKRMHYFARESNNNLTITTSAKEVLLQTQATQIGRDESRIAGSIQGEKNKIALSSSYLLDFLSHISGEEIEMQLTDKMHPAVFRVPGTKNFLHLVMPLRMAEEA
jgi:DNA polymerase III subunit beta